MMQGNVNHQKPIVIAVGLFLPGSSFTRVFESLFARLSADYDIHWMGIGYINEIISTDDYSLYPVNKNGGDFYGAYASASMAQLLGATTILLLNDFSLLGNYRHALLPLKEKGIKLVGYVPQEGYQANSLMNTHSLFLDDLVLYSERANEAVKNAGNPEDAAVTGTATRLWRIIHGADADWAAIAEQCRLFL